MPAVVAVTLGILLGYAAGGSLGRLGGLKLRFELLIVPLFVLQALARGRLLGLVGASKWSLAVWVASSVLLVGAMLTNWKIPGMAIGVAGILMNLDTTLLNSAMPVVLGGRTELLASVSAAEVASSSGSFYRVAQTGDLLTWMGDVMPVAWGRSMMLVSPGDVVLMVAVVAVIVWGMTVGDGRSSPTLAQVRDAAS